MNIDVLGPLVPLQPAYAALALLRSTLAHRAAKRFLRVKLKATVAELRSGADYIETCLREIEQEEKQNGEHDAEEEGKG